MKVKSLSIAIFIALASMTLLASCFRPRVIVVDSGSSPYYRSARPPGYYRPYYSTRPRYYRSYGHRHHHHH